MVLFCHITTRIEGRKDDGLLATVGGRGFPHLVAMDAEGKVLGSPPGRKVAQFRDFMKLIQEYRELKSKADKGDAVAKVEVFIRALQLGEYKSLEDAKKHYATLKKVSKEQKDAIEGQFVGYEVREEVEKLQQVKDKSEGMELQKEIGKKFAEWEKAGRVPKKNEDAWPFYFLILVHAEDVKDIPLFEKSFGAMKDRFGSDMNPRFAEAKEKVLERLKAEQEEKK